mgnify:CR=1 FL=1
MFITYVTLCIGIDNGIKRISNLQPLGMTLTTLCLCDQVSTVVYAIITYYNRAKCFIQ